MLLGDHLCEKSDQIRWISADRPEKRKRRLVDYNKLLKLQEENPNLDKIFEDNLIDTFYPKRPDELESVCLYDFVKDYEKIGVDGTGLPM